MTKHLDSMEKMKKRKRGLSLKKQKYALFAVTI